jgi:hypothetical protein
MTSHCRRIPIVALLTVVSSAALPAAAMAGSLLSGYGGPGQGNQAILGSALLNGSGSGGRGSGGGAASSTGLEASYPSAAVKEGSTGSVRDRRASKPGAAANRRSSSVSGNGAQGHAPALAPAALAAATDSSGTLGLSGADLVYILLALAVLAMIGVLTRQLTHRPNRNAR